MTHQLARDSLKATLAPVNETNYSELFAERSMKMFKKASVETPSLRNIQSGNNKVKLSEYHSGSKPAH